MCYEACSPTLKLTGVFDKLMMQDDIDLPSGLLPQSHPSFGIASYLSLQHIEHCLLSKQVHVVQVQGDNSDDFPLPGGGCDIVALARGDANVADVVVVNKGVYAGVAPIQRALAKITE